MLLAINSLFILIIVFNRTINIICNVTLLKMISPLINILSCLYMKKKKIFRDSGISY